MVKSCDDKTPRFTPQWSVMTHVMQSFPDIVTRSLDRLSPITAPSPPPQVKSAVSLNAGGAAAGGCLSRQGSLSREIADTTTRSSGGNGTTASHSVVEVSGPLPPWTVHRLVHAMQVRGTRHADERGT